MWTGLKTERKERFSLSESLLRQQNENQKTLNDDMWTGLQTASRDRFSLWTPPQATKGKAENTKRRNVDGLTDRTQRKVLSLSESLLRQQKEKQKNAKRRNADGLIDSKQRQALSLNPSSGNKRKSRKTLNGEMRTGLQTASKDRLSLSLSLSLLIPPHATKGKVENAKRRNVDGLTDNKQRETLSSPSKMITLLRRTELTITHSYQAMIWAAPRQNQTNSCAPSEDTDQPGQSPSLIRVFAVCLKKPWVLNFPLGAQRRLWSDWMDAQADVSVCWA